MKQSLRVSVLGIAALLASAAMMPQWVVGGEVEEQGCTPQITSCPAETITVTAESVNSKGTPCGYEVPDLRNEVVVDLCGEQFISCIEQMPAPGTVVGIGDTVITLLAYECDGFVMPPFGNPDSCTNDETCSLITGSCTTTLTVEPPEPDLTCGEAFDPINVDQGCLVTVPDITGLVTVEACVGVTYTVVQSPPAGASIFPQFGNELQITVSLEEFPNVSCNAYIPVLPVAACPTSDKLTAQGPDNCTAELPDYCNAYLQDCLVDAVTEARGFNKGFFELICEQSPAPGTMLDIGTTDVTLTISECFLDFPNQQRGEVEECFVIDEYTCTFPVTVNAPPAQLICQDFFTVLEPVVLEDDCLFTVPDVTGEVMVDACEGAEYTIVQDPAAGTEIEIEGMSLLIFVRLDQQMSQTCFIEIPFNPVQSCPDSPQEIAYDENCEATVPDLTGEVDIMDCCVEFVGKGAAQRADSFCGQIRITQTPEAGEPLTEPTEVTITVERCFVFDNEQLLQRGIDEGGDRCMLLDTCVVQLNPVDNTPPTFTCPDDLAVNADENCMGVVPDVTGVVDASDNCTASADLTVTQDPAAGTVIGLGTTLFTVTVTDAAGNSESCTVMVELLENGCMDEPPAPDEPGDEEPGAPQPVPGCDSDNPSLNLLFSLLFHSPVCGATCPLMLTLTLCGISALRLRKRRRNR